MTRIYSCSFALVLTLTLFISEMFQTLFSLPILFFLFFFVVFTVDLRHRDNFTQFLMNFDDHSTLTGPQKNIIVLLVARHWLWRIHMRHNFTTKVNRNDMKICVHKPLTSIGRGFWPDFQQKKNTIYFAWFNVGDWFHRNIKLCARNIPTNIKYTHHPIPLRCVRGEHDVIDFAWTVYYYIYRGAANEWREMNKNARKKMNINK